MADTSQALPAEKKIPTKFSTSQQVVLNGHAQPAQRKDNNIQPQQEGTVIDENLNEQRNEAANQNNDAPELTTEQLKAWFKKNNINFDGDEKSLKEKLEYTPPQAAAAQPTPEELQAQTRAKEKRILDLWVAKGGKPEDFYTTKKVAEADVAELSESELRRELKAEGFATKEEQDEIINHRYFVNQLDSIEQGEDESDEDFTKRKEALEKKVKYGAKKLANRSIHIKEQAGKIIDGFTKLIEQEDLEAKEEETFAKNVDEHFKTLPKEAVVELGEIAKGFTVDPIKHPYSEESVRKAVELLKNPIERNNFLFTPDGSLNLPNLARLLVNDFEQQEIYKSIYVDATTRNTEVFRKKFPMTSAQGLGVGSAPQKTAKPNLIPTKVGQPTRI